MGKKLTDEEKAANAAKRAAKKAEEEAAAAANSTGEGEGVQAATDAKPEADTQAKGEAELTEVPIEPCPACPDGKVRLRSRYVMYRWRGVQFHGHCAIVDQETLERAQQDPLFGQGKDFWIDQQAA